MIIETIKLLKKRWQIPHPILVTAHTNAAVDNLLSGLREYGIKAARLGREEVVREDLRGYTTARLMESHPLFPQLDALMTERDAQQAELKAAQAWQSKRQSDSSLIHTCHSSLGSRHHQEEANYAR